MGSPQVTVLMVMIYEIVKNIKTSDNTEI